MIQMSEIESVETTAGPVAALNMPKPRAEASARKDVVGIHRSPTDLARSASAPLSVVLNVIERPKAPPSARQQALTNVHHRIALAMLANHSAFRSRKRCT